MTTLGEILARLQDEAEIDQILLESGDMPLLAQLRCRSQQEGIDQCDMALRAVEAFTRKANDEAWVKLMGRIQDTPSPAGACLSEMIAWSMAR